MTTAILINRQGQQEFKLPLKDYDKPSPLWLIHDSRAWAFVAALLNGDHFYCEADNEQLELEKSADRELKALGAV